MQVGKNRNEQEEKPNTQQSMQRREAKGTS